MASSLFRYILCMGLLLLRVVLNELTRPRTPHMTSLEANEAVNTTVSDQQTVNITENKLCDFAAQKEQGSSDASSLATQTTFLTYKAEADNYALQHHVNKLKQHHRRAFELISRALQIDEETGSKDTRQEFFKFYGCGTQEPEFVNV
jgi:hypothetical protein